MQQQALSARAVQKGCANANEYLGIKICMQGKLLPKQYGAICMV